MGARMSAQQQRRIREICKARLDRISVDIGKHGVEDPFFDFVLFQAGLLNDRRDLKIEPVEIFNLSSSYSPDDEKFSEHLQRWRDGWALVFREKGVRKEKFT